MTPLPPRMRPETLTLPVGSTPSREANLARRLRADLARRAFSSPRRRGGRLHVGVELEWIPLVADTGRPCPVQADSGHSVISFLERLGTEAGWKRGSSAAGAPSFRSLEGGEISVEPGGQIEYSSPIFHGTGPLLRDLERVGHHLESGAGGVGIRLESLGIDPVNPLARTELGISTPRYRRMARALGRRGPAAHRMMRQTAALHVNLDWGPDPALQWRVAHALVPSLIAIFANSSRYEGVASGFRSFRSQQWRELEDAAAPSPDGTEERVGRYLRYALQSPSILTGREGDEPVPFSEDPCRMDLAAWHEHLTTLFPEVRPRGYLEIRSMDALPAEWRAVPLVFLLGILYDLPALREAGEILPRPTGEERREAGRIGLRDPARRTLAASLFGLALKGARRLGEAVVDGASVTRAREFMEEFTLRGLDPGDAQSGRIEGSSPGASSTSE